MATRKTWGGTPPEKCDICAQPIVWAFVDTIDPPTGSWCNMCTQCFLHNGPPSLGTGKGQLYVKELSTGGWVKVA